MDETVTDHDEESEAVAAYLSASEKALESARSLSDAWRQHFQEGAEPPAPDLIAQVAQQQMASDLALGRARSVKHAAARAHLPIEHNAGSVEQSPAKVKRRRRRENKFLANIGKPGQRLLRSVLLVLLVLAVLVAVGEAKPGAAIVCKRVKSVEC